MAKKRLTNAALREAMRQAGKRGGKARWDPIKSARRRREEMVRVRSFGKARPVKRGKAKPQPVEYPVIPATLTEPFTG